ncbi:MULTISPECIES: metal ABC transporter permease [Paenibacillus]|uniref:metal ABC transporter permease n=1 Tax=Paenibacillus TaxID=44249 RepID=UPI0009558A1F|nr:MULTISPECIES: iron chelate uptake ABC transporter family permease subunit [Paenibacillus]ASS66696.1 metal ABC transporter permease [Paenibacillus sp. RUD330]SIP98381.1 manganese/zinc/iron transport system permease protein [Paenibacillus sp. RU4X]SIQ17179.1 manganese/zinc/iron transport system permease protein [Paenibacillus sp. RU4T]
MTGLWASIEALASDPNLRWIALGCMLLGLSSGMIGCFAYLRRQSLMGDTIAHTALPGICVAFLLTGVKSLPVFMLGAVVAGIAGTLAIRLITSRSRIKADAAMGIVLSSFFGIGIVLLTMIQHSGDGSQSGLDKFLFGQAASMVGSDVRLMAGVCLLLAAVCTLLFKEFKLLSFDPAFAKGAGFPTGLLDFMMQALVVVAVVAGIQAVGVVLVAALLITPAVSARFWTERLGRMILLSGLFGAVSGLLGAWISSQVSQLPTGPVSVLAAAAIFLLSVAFGSRKGLVVVALTRRGMRRSLEPAASASKAKEAG